MAIFLRQSTASQEIPLGYFVDSTDGNTEETGLTIANTDIKLWKTGATTLANKNSGGGTHISNGIYYAVLDATDTDTIGPMVVFCHISASALPVRVECCVLDEAVYDVIFGTTALSTYAGGAVASVTGAVGSVTGAVGSVTAGVTLANGAVTNASLAGNMEIVFETDFATNYNTTTDKWQVEASTTEDSKIATGTAQSVTGTTIRLAASETFADDEIIGATVVITGGSTGVGQSRIITDYTSSTDTATVDTWTTTPTGTITYAVYATPPSSSTSPASVNVVQISGDSTAADNLESYCDGTTPQPVNATQISGDATAADNLEAAFDGTGYDIGGVDVSELNQIVDDLINGGRLDLLIDAIKAKTDSLTFTVANQVDSNLQSINDVTVTGNGGTGTEFSV